MYSKLASLLADSICMLYGIYGKEDLRPRIWDCWCNSGVWIPILGLQESKQRRKSFWSLLIQYYDFFWNTCIIRYIGRTGISYWSDIWLLSCPLPSGRAINTEEDIVTFVAPEERWLDHTLSAKDYTPCRNLRRYSHAAARVQPPSHPAGTRGEGKGLIGERREG